jgi:hypothetical protein
VILESESAFTYTILGIGLVEQCPDFDIPLEALSDLLHVRICRHLN